MKTPYNPITRTVPANGETTIDANGVYVACLDATGDFSMAFDDSPSFPFEPGLKVDLPKGAETNGVRVINEGGADIVVTLAFGHGDFHDGRLTASGTLDVQGAAGMVPLDVQIAGGAAMETRDYWTMANYYMAFSQPAVGSAYARVQLRNPAASGKLLEVALFDILSVGSGSAVTVRKYDASIIGLGTEGRALDFRAPASAARVHGGNTATTMLTELFTIAVSGRTRQRVETPIILSEGTGIVIEAPAINVAMSAGMEWREWPV